ncbi:MAG: hypothetical protein KBD94_03595 [Pyrinomonadaceae bacterium]|nr:hypothetical protein [Pyrinomonadaceae bacterium]
MGADLAKRIFEKVKELSSDEQEKILDYVEQRAVPIQTRDSRPIWEVITEMSSEIPDEMWAELPTDGSINHDHYLYGTPKKKV